MKTYKNISISLNRHIFSEPIEKQYTSEHIFQKVLGQACTEFSVEEKMDIINIFHQGESMLKNLRYKNKNSSDFHHIRLNSLFSNLSAEQQRRAGLVYHAAQAYYEFVYADLEKAADHLQKSTNLFKEFSYVEDANWAFSEQSINLLKVYLRACNWSSAELRAKILIDHLINQISDTEKEAVKLDEKIDLGFYYIDYVLSQFLKSTISKEHFLEVVPKLFMLDINFDHPNLPINMKRLLLKIKLLLVGEKESFLTLFYEDMILLKSYNKHIQFVLSIFVYNEVKESGLSLMEIHKFRDQIVQYFGAQIDSRSYLKYL